MCGACEDEVFLTVPDPRSVLSGTVEPAGRRIPHLPTRMRPAGASLFQASETFGTVAAARPAAFG
jgi:hypothetical protein